MLGFTVTQLKTFTAQLFLGSAFDGFFVTEAAFLTSFRTDFDGRSLREDAGEPFIRWARLRPLAFSLIKGRTLPRAFTIVFRLPADETAEVLSAAGLDGFLPDAVGLFLNIRYAHEQLRVTSGCLSQDLAAGRALEKAWDRQASLFFEKIGIKTE